MDDIQICPKCGTVHGAQVDCDVMRYASASHFFPYAPDPKDVNRARYRNEAERCGRDGIVVMVQCDFTPESTIVAQVSHSSGFFGLRVPCDPNPEEWPHQARELVNKVHRIREGLRQMGVEI